jgi:hypothetical protein
MNFKNFPIPLKRLPFYAGIFALAPLFVLAFAHFAKLKEWTEVEMSINQIQLHAQTKKAKQAVNSIVRKQFASCSPSYIEDKIESLVCLKKEQEGLEKLFQSPSYRGNEEAAKRYHFITLENKLRFSETTTQMFDDVCETQLSTPQPVEIDTEDLKMLLSYVEQKHPKQPLLLIKDFSLSRTKTSMESEVFLLSMTLLKREFSS